MILLVATEANRPHKPSDADFSIGSLLDLETSQLSAQSIIRGSRL